MAKRDRPPLQERALFTVEEAADYLRVSRAMVFRLLKDGKLPRAKIGNRTVIRRSDLDALVERSIGPWK